MDFPGGVYSVSFNERQEIHTILDSAEYAFLGTHSPYESIQALDEQCSQLFPGWKKSLVSTRPIQPNIESQTLTEVFADDPSIPEPSPGKTAREAIAADLMQLKDDVQNLISRVSESFPDETTAPGATPPTETPRPSPPKRKPRTRQEKVALEEPNLATPPVSAPELGSDDPIPATVRGLEKERAQLRNEQQFLVAQRSELRKQVRALEKSIARANFELKKSEAARNLTIRASRARG